MISIIIPTYNESKNISRLLLEVYTVLRSTGQRFEIIVVDDNSPDKTWKAASKYSRYNVKVIRRKNDRGLSSAVIRGFKAAKGDVLGVMDADLSHPPRLLLKMIDAITDEGNEIVIASRHIRGGKAKFSLYRKAVSAGAKILSLPLTDVSDPMSGYFMLRRKILNGAQLKPKGYKILLEILVKCDYDYTKVLEVPLVFVNRKYGHSKLGFRVSLDYIIHLVSLYVYKLSRVFR